MFSPLLQVGETGPDWFSVYLIPETLRITVMGVKGEGDSVNVEMDAQTQVGQWPGTDGSTLLPVWGS